MLGVDTNVLVRLLVSDDTEQQRAAVQRLNEARAANNRVLITTVVITELSWVLDACYGYGRDRIADAIESLAATPLFEVAQHDAVVEAADRYRTGAADFADYLIAALSFVHDAIPILTFDKRLAAEPDCELP